MNRDAAAAKQIINVSASSWLFSSNCMPRLLLVQPVADVMNTFWKCALFLSTACAKYSVRSALSFREIGSIPLVCV